MTITRKVFLLLVTFFACVELFAQDSQTLQSSPSLSIEECLCLAKANNNQVYIAEYKVFQAIAEKNEVRSQLLPHILADGTWTNNTNSLDGDLTQFQNFKSRKAVGLSANLTLWDFLVSWNHLRASTLRIQASVQQKENTLFELEENVRNAFIRTLQQEKTIQLVEHSIKTLEQQLQTSKDLFDQGLSKYSDVLSVQVQLSEKRQNLIQEKNQLIAHQMTLNQLTGRPLFQSVQLKDLTTDPTTHDFDQAFQFSLCHRPDLLALETQRNALGLDHSAGKWSYAPQFYAFANTNYAASSTSVSAGVGLKMPIYEGGRKRAQIQKIKSQLCQLNATIDELTKTIAIDLKNTCLQFEEILQSLELDKQTISLAEENLSSSMKFYKEGLQSINDVLTAEDQFLAAKIKHLSNLYRYHHNYAHLVKVSGGYAENHNY